MAEYLLVAPAAPDAGFLCTGLRGGRQHLGNFCGAAVMGRAEGERQVRWGSRHHKMVPRTKGR